jgi:hypothetical protein
VCPIRTPPPRPRARTTHYPPPAGNYPGLVRYHNARVHAALDGVRGGPSAAPVATSASGASSGAGAWLPEVQSSLCGLAGVVGHAWCAGAAADIPLDLLLEVVGVCLAAALACAAHPAAYAAQVRCVCATMRF